jgi:hypothetical protein
MATSSPQTGIVIVLYPPASLRVALELVPRLNAWRSRTTSRNSSCFGCRLTIHGNLELDSATVGSEFNCELLTESSTSATGLGGSATLGLEVASELYRLKYFTINL